MRGRGGCAVCRASVVGAHVRPLVQLFHQEPVGRLDVVAVGLQQLASTAPEEVACQAGPLNPEAPLWGTKGRRC